MIQDIHSPVVYQEALGGDYYRLGLETKLSGFVPGQFGMLEVPPVEGILLRRPFSLAKQEGGVTEILYKVVGKGTQALSQVAKGQSLKLLAPLGNGFGLKISGSELVGVAGGYGVAPFLQMALQFQQEGKVLKLFYGARTASDLLYLEEFKALGVELFLTTEDGSKGFSGRVTELLAQEYGTKNPNMVWSCGPMGLLAAVQQWCAGQGVPCEVSVEETMGCGTGVCLGCVVQDRQGHYLRACVEGPVFPGEQLCLAKD